MGGNSSLAIGILGVVNHHAFVAITISILFRKDIQSPGVITRFYTRWRAPDLTGVQDPEAVKVRENGLNAVVAKLRAEVRRFIDERPVKIHPHYDSVTGSTSVVRLEEAKK